MKAEIQDKDYFLQLQQNFKESILYLDSKILKYNLFQEDILNEIELLKTSQKELLENLLIELYTNSCRCNYQQSHKINRKIIDSNIKKKIVINYIDLIKILQHREEWIEQLDLYCQIQNDRIQQKRINDEAQYKELSSDFQNLSLKATKIVKLQDKFDGLRIQDDSQQVESKKSQKEISKIKLKNNLLNQDLDQDSDGCEEKLQFIQQQLKEFKGMNIWYNISKEQRDTMLIELNKYQLYNEIKQNYLYYCSTEIETKFVFKFNSIKMIDNYQKWFNNCSILERLEQNLQICQGNILKINQTKQQVMQRIDDIEAILSNELQ